MDMLRDNGPGQPLTLSPGFKDWVFPAGIITIVTTIMLEALSPVGSGNFHICPAKGALKQHPFTLIAGNPISL